MNDFIILEYVDDDNTKRLYNLNTTKRITDPTMTQYEYTKLLSVRAKQIQLGSKPLIEIDDNINKFKYAIEVAKKEINERVIPFYIVRKILDNKNEKGYREEKWNIRELNIRDN